MMFRLRSNDVAPKARNDVPFVRDKRYFDSVGEGFPLPSIIAKITVCLQIVGDGATGFVAKFHTRYRLRVARRFFVRVILSGA